MGRDEEPVSFAGRSIRQYALRLIPSPLFALERSMRAERKENSQSDRHAREPFLGGRVLCALVDLFP